MIPLKTPCASFMNELAGKTFALWGMAFKPKSNTTRKDFIAENILKCKPRIVGIYRLMMKSGSDNFRASSI